MVTAMLSLNLAVHARLAPRVLWKVTKVVIGWRSVHGHCRPDWHSNECASINRVTICKVFTFLYPRSKLDRRVVDELGDVLGELFGLWTGFVCLVLSF